MALSQELIDTVKCPKCTGDLELPADQSAFLCRPCGLSYEVIDDIPNFLVEDAKPLSAGSERR